MELQEYIDDTSKTLTLMEREDLIPEKIRVAYSELPDHLRGISEAELRNTHNYTVTDERLRVSFWRQVTECTKSGKQIVAKKIFTGICSEPYFYQKYLTNPNKIAWMLQPVMPYEARTDALLNLAVSRYEEIINMDITTTKKTIVGIDDDGKPKHEYIKQIDVKKAELLLKTINVIEDRVKGMATQKSVNINETAPAGAKVEAMDMKEVEKKIASLQRLERDGIIPAPKGEDATIVDAVCVEVNNE